MVFMLGIKCQWLKYSFVCDSPARVYSLKASNVTLVMPHVRNVVCIGNMQEKSFGYQVFKLYHIVGITHSSGVCQKTSSSGWHGWHIKMEGYRILFVHVLKWFLCYRWYSAQYFAETFHVTVCRNENFVFKITFCVMSYFLDLPRIQKYCMATWQGSIGV